MRRVAAITGGLLALCAFVIPDARAGVTNPNISVIGQPTAIYTDDRSSPDARHVRMDVGETEFIFDAYLNPYATGAFVAALAGGGIELEEGYFTLLRGLPAGLTLKGGKYRVGFGKLNPVHPHAYPFAERFHVLAAYLPGDEAYNETGFSVSERLPVPGEVAVTATADLLQGDSFRIDRGAGIAAAGGTLDPSDPLAIDPENGDRAGESRPAWLGRLSAFVPLGDRSGLELGTSATGGTGNVAAKARTHVFGADARAKLWIRERSCLVLQGEFLTLHRDDAGWDAATGRYASGTARGYGGYLYADYAASLRTDFGACYERFQEPGGTKPSDQAFGVFAGYSLLEETTMFRLGWEHFDPELGDAVNTVTFRVLYSMGPHKAHQF